MKGACFMGKKPLFSTLQERMWTRRKTFRYSDSPQTITLHPNHGQKNTVEESCIGLKASYGVLSGLSLRPKVQLFVVMSYPPPSSSSLTQKENRRTERRLSLAGVGFGFGPK